MAVTEWSRNEDFFRNFRTPWIFLVRGGGPPLADGKGKFAGSERSRACAERGRAEMVAAYA